jgi:hypothetical protein
MTNPKKQLIVPSLEASDKKDIKKFNETGVVPRNLYSRFDQKGRFRFFIDDYEPKSGDLYELISKIRKHQLAPEEITSRNNQNEVILHTGIYEDEAETLSGQWDVITGPIYVLCTELSLPNAKNILTLRGKEIKKVDLPKLKKCSSIFLPSVKDLELPELEVTQGGIQASNTGSLVAPKLREVGCDISLRGGREINLNALERVNNFMVLPLSGTIPSISLPNLQVAREISLSRVEEFYAPCIKTLELGIVGTSLKQITIPDEVPFTNLEVSNELFAILREERRKRRANYELTKAPHSLNTH